jgi:hypothetical protein
MLIKRFILCGAAAAMVALPASARPRAVGPGPSEVMAALDRHGEPVQRVSHLVCFLNNDACRRTPQCRFTAIFPSRREPHIAVFQYDGGWRLLDDRPE